MAGTGTDGQTGSPGAGRGPGGYLPTRFAVAEERLAGVREGVSGARKVLFTAARRSRSETRDSWRDLFGILDSSPAPSIQRVIADISDEARSQSFLAAWAALAAGERLGRASLGRGRLAPGRGGIPSLLSPRALAIGTAAADLYSGYAALSRRARTQPGLVVEKDYEEQHRRGAERVLDAARALGGSLIKAGQFASSRPDILPAAYTETLSTLQDRVPPRSFGIIRRAVERETGGPLDDTFSSFEREPVAAASIAQVHRARLLDGREVAVKVRYPEVSALIEEDLDSLETVFDVIARLQPDIRLRPISDYLRWTLPLELDLLRESRAMKELKEAVADREDIVVPAPVEGLCTEGLVVMDYIEGIRVDDLQALSAAGIDRTAVARLVNDAFADQLFRRGIFHADPHPGNLRIQPGPKLVLYDHGLTLKLDREFISSLGRMVAALRDGDLDALSRALGEVGLPVDEDTDLGVLLELVGAVMGTQEGPDGEDEEDEEGNAVDAADLGVTTGRVGAGIRDLPPKLLLVGRAIAFLDGLTRRLDKDVEALDIVARYTAETDGSPSDNGVSG